MDRIVITLIQSPRRTIEWRYGTIEDVRDLYEPGHHGVHGYCYRIECGDWFQVVNDQASAHRAANELEKSPDRVA